MVCVANKDTQQSTKGYPYGHDKPGHENYIDFLRWTQGYAWAGDSPAPCADGSANMDITENEVPPPDIQDANQSSGRDPPEWTQQEIALTSLLNEAYPARTKTLDDWSAIFWPLPETRQLRASSNVPSAGSLRV